MTIKFDDVLGALPSLSHTQLEALQLAVGALLAQGATPLADDPTQPLYEAVKAATGTRVTLDMYRQASSYRHWRRNAPLALAFIAETFPTCRTVMRAGLYRHMIEILMTDLKGLGVPVGVSTIATHLHRLPEVFENAYPGYRESGLTHLIYKAIEGK